MIIYKITNNINGKSYVGQTKRTLQERWNGHCRKEDCVALHNAIEKYGKENFTVEEIDRAESEEELNLKEAYWIDKLNTMHPNGYNLRTGGCRFELSDISKEKLSKTVKQLWDNGKYEVTWNRPVCQYSKSGKLIATYNSIKEACEALGKPNLAKHIPSVCKKERISTGGYVWRYYENEHSEQIEVQKRRDLPQSWKDNHRKPINQLTLDGQMVKRWDSALEASETIGFSNGYLCETLKGRRDKAYGYRWEYANNEAL